MSSPRNKLGATNSAGKQRSPALRRMSHAAVRQLIGPDVHDLSHGRAVGQAKGVSAIKQLQHEIRSRASRANGQSGLCQLSSTFAWRRGTFDPGGLQRSYNLLSLSHTEREVRRQGYFFLRSLPPAGPSCSHAYNGSSISCRLQPRKARPIGRIKLQ